MKTQTVHGWFYIMTTDVVTMTTEPFSVVMIKIFPTGLNSGLHLVVKSLVQHRHSKFVPVMPELFMILRLVAKGIVFLDGLIYNPYHTCACYVQGRNFVTEHIKEGN